MFNNLLMSCACSSKIKIKNNIRTPMKIIITVGSQNFTATLENNESAKAFAEQLPLTINMNDLNDNEKYYNLNSDIKKDASFNPGKIKAGDIMLYSSNCLVLFYKTFSTSYSYVPIGHIDDVDKYVEALGKKAITVTFKLQN